MAITSPKAVQDTQSGTANPAKKTGNLILAVATALGPTANAARRLWAAVARHTAVALVNIMTKRRLLFICYSFSSYAALFQEQGNRHVQIKVTHEADGKSPPANSQAPFRWPILSQIQKAYAQAVMHYGRMLHFLQWVNVFLALSRIMALCNLALCADVHCDNWPA